MGRLRSGHHPELKYWLHKIGRAVDTICRKCGIGEETAELVVFDCPGVNHPLDDPTPPDTLAKNPQKKIANAGEVYLRPRPTRCLTAGYRHHLIYPSNLSPPTHSPIPSNTSQCPTILPSFPVSSTLILSNFPRLSAQQQQQRQRR